MFVTYRLYLTDSQGQIELPEAGSVIPVRVAKIEYEPLDSPLDSQFATVWLEIVND